MFTLCLGSEAGHVIQVSGRVAFEDVSRTRTTILWSIVFFKISSIWSVLLELSFSVPWSGVGKV